MIYQSKLVRYTAMELQGAPGKPLIPKLTFENYLNLEHLDVIAPAILRKVRPSIIVS